MKFQADKEVLSDAISFVVRLVSPRPQLPQLSGVVIEASNNEVTLSIFDYEVSAKAKTSSCQWEVSRAVSVPLKVLILLPTPAVLMMVRK